MRYYKILVNNSVIGVGDSGNLRKYQKKHKILLSCDENNAEYFDLNETLYHAIWMLLPDNEQYKYVNAEVIEINKDEYDVILAYMDNGEEIPQEEPEPEPQPEEEPISEEEQQQIETEKKKKLAELSNSCTKVIENGFDITLSDNKEHHFSLTTNDQLNLITLSAILESGEQYIPYHADGELCIFYSPEDAGVIIESATQWKTYHVTYYNSLKSYVNSLNDVDEIKRINYGIAIPEEYESEVLKALYRA